MPQTPFRISLVFLGFVCVACGATRPILNPAGGRAELVAALRAGIDGGEEEEQQLLEAAMRPASSPGGGASVPELLAIVERLQWVGSERAVEPLAQLLDHSHVDVVGASAAALATIGTDQALAVLEEALSTPGAGHVEREQSVLAALPSSTHPEARRLLRETAHDDRGYLRPLALRAMGETRDDHWIPFLREAAEGVETISAPPTIRHYRGHYTQYAGPLAKTALRALAQMATPKANQVLQELAFDLTYPYQSLALELAVPGLGTDSETIDMLRTSVLMGRLRPAQLLEQWPSMVDSPFPDWWEDTLPRTHVRGPEHADMLRARSNEEHRFLRGIRGLALRGTASAFHTLVTLIKESPNSSRREAIFGTLARGFPQPQVASVAIRLMEENEDPFAMAWLFEHGYEEVLPALLRLHEQDAETGVLRVLRRAVGTTSPRLGAEAQRLLLEVLAALHDHEPISSLREISSLLEVLVRIVGPNPVPTSIIATVRELQEGETLLGCAFARALRRKRGPLGAGAIRYLMGLVSTEECPHAAQLRLRQLARTQVETETSEEVGSFLAAYAAEAQRPGSAAAFHWLLVHRPMEATELIEAQFQYHPESVARIVIRVLGDAGAEQVLTWLISHGASEENAADTHSGPSGADSEIKNVLLRLAEFRSGQFLLDHQEVLEELFTSGTNQTRVALVEALGRSWLEGSRNLLRRAFEDPSEDVRAAAWHAFRSSPGGLGVDLVGAGLLDDDRRVRTSAALQLVYLRRSGVEFELVPLLENRPDLVVAALDWVEFREPFLEYLRAGTREDVRLQILRHIRGNWRHDMRESHVALFVSLAADPSPAIRAAAIRILSSLPGEEVQETVVQALADADAAVRRAALAGVPRFRLPTAEVAKHFLDAFSDTEAEVRVAALLEAAQHGSWRDLVIDRMLDRSLPTASRREAATALRREGSRLPMKALRTMERLLRRGPTR